jgi:hypothetical protein
VNQIINERFTLVRAQGGQFKHRNDFPPVLSAWTPRSTETFDGGSLHRELGADGANVLGKFVRIIAQRWKTAQKPIQLTDREGRTRLGGVRRAITLSSRSRSTLTPSK